MKQTEKVSIGGYSFILERDAYERLNGYIEDIRATYSSNTYASEIMGDIEQRIAELFIEKGGKAGIVDYAMVDSIIQMIGSPAELADEEKIEGQEADRANTGNAYRQDKSNAGETTARRLYRDIDNRVLGGVCSGIASYFNISDPVIPRLIAVCIVIGVALIINMGGTYNFEGALVASAFFSLIAYILLWVIIPAAKTVEQKCALSGKPMELKQFQEKFENRTFKETVREAGSAPALHAIGRAISIILGIFLITAGVASLIGCTTYDLVRELIEKEIDFGHIGYYDDEDIIISQIFMRPAFWWITVSALGLFGIWLIYNGVLLAFNLRAPRWRPGTIIFILWILSLLVMTVWIIRRMLIIGTLL